MPKIDIKVSTPTSQSVRAAQVSSMFDVPPALTASLEWKGDLPIEGRDWSIGLIVGPSGAGKSTILRQIFGEELRFDWHGDAVIDDFDKKFGIEEVTQSCSAVGFNTIPSWRKPHKVLSTGEKFRVDLARRLLEGGDLVVCDEFSSVVDRQVAQIGAHAVQKFIRRTKRQFVAASCHYDLEPWLQPDWVLEPATMTFRWRAVQRRPAINCRISRVSHSAWPYFARFHYLTADMHKGAQCFCLYVDDVPTSFLGMLFRPHQVVKNLWGGSRGVTLPDFQGLGLQFVLNDMVAAAFKTRGFRVHHYPAHPGYIRSFDRSTSWAMFRKPGITASNRKTDAPSIGKFGGRPCAVFDYVGPALSKEDADKVFGPAKLGATV